MPDFLCKELLPLPPGLELVAALMLPACPLPHQETRSRTVFSILFPPSGYLTCRAVCHQICYVGRVNSSPPTHLVNSRARASGFSLVCPGEGLLTSLSLHFPIRKPEVELYQLQWSGSASSLQPGSKPQLPLSPGPRPPPLKACSPFTAE